MLAEDAEPGNPGDGGPDDLLHRFVGGDDSALAELVERESPRLLRRIRERLPSGLRRRVGESDILQLTAIDLLAIRDRFEDRGLPAFRRLLDTIADINIARAVEREGAAKRNFRAERSPVRTPDSLSSPPDPLDGIPGSVSSPSAPLRREERAARLEACLAELGDADREAIRLIDGVELSYEEAARSLGISPDTLRRRHSRAIARLRTLLERGPDA